MVDPNVLLALLFGSWVLFAILLIVLTTRHAHEISRAHENFGAHHLYIARLFAITRSQAPEQVASAVQMLEPMPELTPEEILGYEHTPEVTGFSLPGGEVVDFLRKPPGATFGEEDAAALIQEDKDGSR